MVVPAAIEMNSWFGLDAACVSVSTGVTRLGLTAMMTTSVPVTTSILFFVVRTPDCYKCIKRTWIIFITLISIRSSD